MISSNVWLWLEESRLLLLATFYYYNHKWLGSYSSTSYVCIMFCYGLHNRNCLQLQLDVMQTYIYIYIYSHMIHKNYVCTYIYSYPLLNWNITRLINNFVGAHSPGPNCCLLFLMSFHIWPEIWLGPLMHKENVWQICIY